MFHHVAGIAADPADERRTPAVQPWQTQKVEAWFHGDPSQVLGLTGGVKDGQFDPGKTDPIPGCPDQGLYAAEQTPVGQFNRPPPIAHPHNPAYKPQGGSGEQLFETGSLSRRNQRPGQACTDMRLRPSVQAHQCTGIPKIRSGACHRGRSQDQ